MNVLRIELIREIHDLCEYKITYEENEIFTVKVVGHTFNYDYEDTKNIPERVLDFVEHWIIGKL